jgi:hypothetical protein
MLAMSNVLFWWAARVSPSILCLDKQYDLDLLLRDLASAEAAYSFRDKRHSVGKSSAALYRKTRGWSAIALRSPGGQLGDAGNRYGGRGSEQMEDTSVLRQACPYFAHIIADLAAHHAVEELHGVRLLRLAPGGYVAHHTDSGFSGRIVRLHIPVVSHPRATMDVGSCCGVHMRPGALWYVDVSMRHSVTNPSPVARVHLVLDLVLRSSGSRVACLTELGKGPCAPLRRLIEGSDNEVEHLDPRWRKFWHWGRDFRNESEMKPPLTLFWTRHDDPRGPRVLTTPHDDDGPTGAAVAVVLIQYRRLEHLSKLLAQLNVAADRLRSRDGVRCDLFVWLNPAPEDPEASMKTLSAIRAVSRRGWHSVRLHVASSNLGGVARFVVATQRAADYKRFIFVDDDVQVGNNSLRTLYAESKCYPRSLCSFWAFRFARIPGALRYGKRHRVLSPGERAHYGGTAGMIAPTEAFRDKCLLADLPQKYWRVEDLWLSAHWAGRGGDRAVRHSGAALRCRLDPNTLSVALHRQPGIWDAKSGLLQYLHEHYDGWPWPHGIVEHALRYLASYLRA